MHLRDILHTSWLPCLTTLCALVMSTACHREELSDPSTTGKGSLTMHIGTRALPAPGDATEGTGMNNLTVLLVDKDNIIQARHNETFTNATETTIQFQGLELGNYTVYAFANEENQNNTQHTVGSEFVVQTPNHGLQPVGDLPLTPLTGVQTPVPLENGTIFLTARQPIAIGVGENRSEVEMQRPFARFVVELYNHSTHPMRVPLLNFGNFNSSLGYIFSHNGAIPPGNQDRALPPYDKQDAIIAPDTPLELYSTYLYESRNTSAFHYSMKVQITDQNDGYSLLPAPVDEEGVFTISADGIYLCNVEGTLKGVRLTADPGTTQAKYNWKFVRINSNQWYIKSALDGLYICLDGGMLTYLNYAQTFTIGNSASSRITATNNELLYMDRRTKSEIGNHERGVWHATEGATGANDTQHYLTWNFHKRVTGKQMEVIDQPIIIVDSETAKPHPMTEIRRNQDIRLVINAYYNDLQGQFNYEVEPWGNGGDQEIEFN